jgi:hypothetical protein
VLNSRGEFAWRAGSAQESLFDVLGSPRITSFSPAFPAFLSREDRHNLSEAALENGTCRIPTIVMGSMGAIGGRPKPFPFIDIERPKAREDARRNK